MEESLKYPPTLEEKENFKHNDNVEISKDEILKEEIIIDEKYENYTKNNDDKIFNKRENLDDHIYTKENTRIPSENRQRIICNVIKSELLNVQVLHHLKLIRN